jgi:hypothetical protein
MGSAFGKLVKTAFFTRHYRSIVFAMVLVNTALIVFLVVYIWAYGLEPRDTRSLGAQSSLREEPVEHFVTGTVLADKLVVRSKPGGFPRGGKSQGIIDRGKSVQVLRSVEVDGDIWLEVAFGKLNGWVPAKGIRSDGLAPWD